jgi:hypothetical protein
MMLCNNNVQEVCLIERRVTTQNLHRLHVSSSPEVRRAKSAARICGGRLPEERDDGTFSSDGIMQVTKNG